MRKVSFAGSAESVQRGITPSRALARLRDSPSEAESRRKAEPYAKADPIGDIAALRSLIEQLQDRGVSFGVISWGAKYSSARYLKRVERAKRFWLAKYLPTITNIRVVDYGTPKSTIAAKISPDDILFDDETRNCEEWASAGGQAIPANDFENILTTLANVLAEC